MAWSDITNGETGLSVRTKLNELGGDVDTKVESNVAIVAATKTKVTYDAKGLVTVGADATTADIADSADKRYVSDAELADVQALGTISTQNSDAVAITGGTVVATINNATEPPISSVQSGAGPAGEFGDGTNNTVIEAGGTVRFDGSATVWGDIDFPIIIRTTGANIPVIGSFQGNLTAPVWEVNDFSVCEGQELVHEWKEASPVYWHVHIYTGGTDVTDRYLKFEVEYTWTNFDSTAPANTTVTSAELLIPANTPAIHHFIYSIANFTPTGGRVGAHVKARLRRIASVGAAPTANPFCEMLQLHIEKDTVGSRTITAK